MPRRSFNRQFATACCTMAAACGRGDSHRNLVRLALAGSSGLQYLPHILASELRFYERNGIEVTTDNVAGGSKAMRALLDGSADVAAGYFDHPIRITARGYTIQCFAVMNKCPGNVVLVSHLAKDRIRSLGDLGAGPIGVTDLGSQAHWFVNYLASAHGVRPDRLNVIPVGVQANALAALQRGSIDVWPGFEPGITRFLKRHPDATILADALSSDGLNRLVGSTTLEALRNSYGMYLPHGLRPAGGPEIAFKVLSASVPELRGESFDLRDTWTNKSIQD